MVIESGKKERRSPISCSNPSFRLSHLQLGLVLLLLLLLKPSHPDSHTSYSSFSAFPLENSSVCPLEDGRKREEGISFNADKSLASLPNIDSRSNLRRGLSKFLLLLLLLRLFLFSSFPFFIAIVSSTK